MTLIVGFLLAVGMVVYIGCPLFVRGVVDDEIIDERTGDEIERAVAVRRGRGKAQSRPHTDAPVGDGANRFCAACGAARKPADRFCSRCGAAFALRCGRCGEAYEAEDAFCASCGLALARG